MKRREFMKNIGCGVAGVVTTGVTSLAARPKPRTRRTRRVVALSDTHIGKPWNDRDGADWLDLALDDIDRNVGPADYGLSLGDITHDGDIGSLRRYLSSRDRSAIPRWFELAGNHEYHNRGIGNYRDLVRSPRPYGYIDGNIAWFFVSSESPDWNGDVSRRSIRWLERKILRDADRVVIVCMHQPPYDTVRRSDKNGFCLYPKSRIRKIVEEAPINLVLCGHEHHEPYSEDCIDVCEGTTVVNVASVSHAYGTGASESVILELEDKKREIVIRRRRHDDERFATDFDLEVPLPTRIALA
jgi:3',5'-cyclic AMP phosphodiesterase CpdA